MSSIAEHYDKLLAQHYTWMCGGFEAKLAESRAIFERADLARNQQGNALDLGCGPGFQSLALADLGFRVLAVDTSDALLNELTQHAGSRAIQCIRADMCDSSAYAAGRPFEVAVCMGDSLTHLPSLNAVADLVRNVHASLEKNGTFILSFRDLAAELTGTDRIIPVRSDESRVMATFLEYESQHVNVHDMIFSRDGEAWTLNKSAYRKLRLGAQRIQDLLSQVGFREVSRATERGFSTIIGRA